MRDQYELCFGKRSAEELYDLEHDPDQINNVAADASYAAAKEELAAQLQAKLVAAQDPRAMGKGDAFFDDHKYLGGGPKWPFKKKAK